MVMINIDNRICENCGKLFEDGDNVYLTVAGYGHCEMYPIIVHRRCLKEGQR